MNQLSLVCLGLTLFATINLPKSLTEHARAWTTGWISPLWKNVAPTHLATLSTKEPKILGKDDQLELLSSWIYEQDSLQKQTDLLASLIEQSQDNTSRPDLLRRIERVRRILAMRYLAMPATVIFREPASWGCCLWIALGEKDNEELGRIVIAPNSPVLLEDALVGVVEYVGQDQSRIRLITDRGLTVAVRALRGGSQNYALAHHANFLKNHISHHTDGFSSQEKRQIFASLLEEFLGNLPLGGKEELLAKGELCGASESFFLAKRPLLVGNGFNYHYADEEGPMRDLASGLPFGLQRGERVELLKHGDLLITSGLDGVFPTGLPVAFVTSIETLSEGDYFYRLTAKPVAENLFDARHLFVLPPLTAVEH